MKKIIAILLVFLMTMQMLPVAANAATAPLELVATVADGTATVVVKSAQEFTGSNFTVQLIVSEGCTITKVAKGADFDEVMGGILTGNKSTGKASCTSGDTENDTIVAAGKELVTYTVDISNAVAAKLTFTVNVTEAGDLNGEPLNWKGATVSSNEVNNPNAAPAADYEIYYTLTGSSKTDSGDDAFTDYNIVDTVTATVYLKNRGESAVNLQAYDIYLTHDNNLIFDSQNLISGVAYKDANNKLTHIQAVGEDSNTKSPISKELPAGVDVSLGTITFKINTAAVYNTQMPVTLTVGTNSKDVTNIGVGTTDSGDPTSYYPADTTEPDGVEVMTTYTVSYDANGGSGAPADQTKYYNQHLTLSTAEPTRDGYNFLGWTTVENPADGADVEYAKGATYSANANDVLYAVWERNTFKVSWYNTNGSEIYSADVNAGATTSFDKTTYTEPSKEKDAQYTYTLKGWSTDSDAELNAEVVDLATYKIEAETKFYPVFSTTVNTYNVYWKNEDGTVLETDLNVPYGEMPEYNGSTPTKVATADKTFTFDKWTPGVETITGEATYTATFTESPRSYTVTYAPGEYGTINKNSETVEYGKVPADLPVVTPAAGYELIGWSDGTTTYAKDLSDYVVEGEVTLTAQYKLVEYEITLDVNGGDEITTNTWKYVITETVTLPEATKTGATFAGWKLETAVGNWEATTYAKGDYTGKYGTVTLVAQWTNDDYTISKGTMVGGDVNLSKTTANYGEEITLTPVPAPGYNEVTYTVTDAKGNTISVENGKFTMPAGNVTVNATFTPIDYTVTVGTVTNGKVTVSQTENVHVADVITLTPAPNPGYQAVTYNVTYMDADGNNQSVNVTDNKFNMPAADVTVTATFAGIDYTVKFDKDATDATGTVNEIAATFGKPIVLGEGTYSRTGYTFLGWATTSGATTATYLPESTIEGAIFTPTAEGQSVTLYAVWQVNTYKITVEESVNGSVTTDAADNEEVAYGTTVTLTATGKEGYELDKYIVTDGNNAEVTVNDGKFTMPASDVTVKATFKAIEYNVILDNSDTTMGAVSADVEKATIGTVVTLSNTPANGYELDKYIVTDGNNAEVTVNDGKFTMPASNVTVKASFKPAMYTITYDLDGGNMPGQVEPNYDITDTVELPKPTKLNYTFKGWKVTKAGGNWAADAVIDANNLTVSGKWGDVTLTAQWDIGFTYSVESYKYAKTGYKMLRIATDGNANAYKFGEETMYYTDNADYVTINGVTSKGVFVTLISGDYVDSNNELTDAAMQMITQTNGAATVIARDGDVNGDEVVNIADANVVYQMVQNGGSYYGNLGNGDQSDILSRLEADMHTETKDNDFRGTLDDVDVIVNDINGTN